MLFVLRVLLLSYFYILHVLLRSCLLSSLCPVAIIVAFSPFSVEFMVVLFSCSVVFKVTLFSMSCCVHD